MSFTSRVAAFLRDSAPEWAFSLVKSIYQSTLRPGKLKGEMDYWRMQALRNNGSLTNDHYRPIMLRMAGGFDESFFVDKIVADFGCGPRGSLAWLSDKSTCIGIDVLSGDYLEEFGGDMCNHNMLYVQSTETIIPLPRNFVDIMFTLNAFDHVQNLDAMAKEIFRVMKVGRFFFGSFNLDEPATVTEPNTLTEENLRAGLFSLFSTKSIRIEPKYVSSPYAGHMGLSFDDRETDARVLWFVGQKGEGEHQADSSKLSTAH
ncbi:MAG: class I SAM-dependent methyltransferase [Rhodobacterales bacterium]